MTRAPAPTIQPPRRRFTGIVVGVFVLCGAIVGFIVARYTFQGQAKRHTQCQINLVALANVILMRPNSGNPLDLSVVAKSQGLELTGGCPGAAHHRVADGARGAWAGYVCVDWSI